MAIQYSGGTNINSTFTNTSGTRREIVDGLVAALTAAGWSTFSGGGTGDVKMKTAITPQGNQIMVRIYDPGSGNCARIQLNSPDGVRVQVGNIHLFPAAGKIWRVIACKYQFFIFVTGSITCREFATASAVYIPPFLTTTTTSGFLVGQAKSDTDTNTSGAFVRTMMAAYHSGYNGHQNSACLNNMTLFETDNLTNNNAYGAVTMAVPYSTNAFGGGYTTPYRWADNSWQAVDPLVGWGSNSVLDEPLIRGQLWDSIVVGESMPSDITIPFDNRTFWNMTANNPVSRHSLFVYVP